jgi:hypothetical protein
MRLLILLNCLFLARNVTAASSTDTDTGANEGVCSAVDLESPLQQEVSKCMDVKCLVEAIATSQSFFDDYFERKPLLLHANPSALQDTRIEWNDVVNLATKGLTWGSSTNGVRLASGSGEFTATAKVGGEAFDASSMHGMPVLRTQLEGPSAISEATVQIGAIHALHSGAAETTRQFQRIFGHAANANLFATPAGQDTVVQMHTDRMDGYVIQLSGQKRWQVHAPLSDVHNPVWGVMGNAEWGKELDKPIPLDLVGEKLVDVVLEPGDILYIPRGFPHTTSTSIGEGKASAGPSISLTMALHTEAQHLVYEKLLRCTFGRTGHCEQPIPGGNGKYCPIGLAMTRYARSERGRELRDSLPIGFLNEGGEWFSFVRALAHKAERLLKTVLDTAKKEGVAGIDDMLDDSEDLSEELVRVAQRVFHVQSKVLEALEEKFAESKGVSNVPFAERQKQWAKLFGNIGAFAGDFCHKEGARALFMDYFSPELEGDVLSKRLK